MEKEQNLEQFGYTQELKRRLKFSDLLVYGLIFMVPIAPFAIFGSVFQASNGMIALAYIVGMLAMMATANSYSHMANEYPMAGSVYTYVGRGMARPLGFIGGWMILLDYILVPTLLYFAASLAMTGMIPAVPVWAWLLIFVALNTTVNYFGIEFTAIVNKVMLVFELIVLAIFLILGIVAIAQGKGRGLDFTAFFNPGKFNMSMVLSAVSIAVLSFLGFDGISTLAEENNSGSKSIGRSMSAALLLVGILFIAQTWVASMLVTNPDHLISAGDPNGLAFYNIAQLAGGHFLFVVTSAATAISWGFANALAAQAATSRLLFSMARDHQLPHFLAKVDKKRGVPVLATFVVAAISLALGLYLNVLPNGLTVISTLVNFGALTAFLLLNIAVVWHFAIRGKKFKIWGHVIIPIIGAIILAFVIINAHLAAQIVGLIWLVIGIIAAVILQKTGKMTDPTVIKED